MRVQGLNIFLYIQAFGSKCAANHTKPIATALDLEVLRPTICQQPINVL